MAKEKSLKTRMLSALVSMVLAFGLLPALPAMAVAEEALGVSDSSGSSSITVVATDFQGPVGSYDSADLVGCYGEFPGDLYYLKVDESVDCIYFTFSGIGWPSLLSSFAQEDEEAEHCVEFDSNALKYVIHKDSSDFLTAKADFEQFGISFDEGFRVDASAEHLLVMLYHEDDTVDYLVIDWLGASASEPSGDDKPCFQLATDAADLKVGQEFTVNVSMENIAAAAQAELTWSENLQLVKVEAGSALSGEDMVLENVAGNGLFSFVANEGEADGVVAVATFKCVAPGEAAVGLTEGLAGKTIDSAEYEIADPEALALSIGLAGITGDVNNNAKINIVDAQIAYDLACGKYAAGSDAAAALLACWGNGATLPMVEAIADVNGEGLDGTDAFAIQYYVHYGKFGE